MSIKTYTLDSDKKPTPKQIKEVENASHKPRVYDEENPELREEQLKHFYKAKAKLVKTN